ncbi:2OG-Fe(II) oxygenase [Pseudomonas sp. MF7453]|uniref:2OG-Fe(II) oxygenase n=1 Tax=Pseudomonas sp. MF7453 TaxID=2797539 RepID=UPI0018E734F8|nr:2OG-Fe(II) oxygenase [Pseudomonas sp. MF7453]MBJ2217522.1 2OG-Fe(II) oxygenase [Pseudomonas sp. MF7453]
MTDHSAVKPTPCISAKILELEQLDSQSLSKLISGQVLAIRVPDFANEKTSARLIHSISETAKLEQYSHETYEGGHVVQHFYGVHRWGTPFNSTYGKATGSEAQRKYYADAAHMRSLIDRICAPQQPPIQALMQQLQAIWPQGAVAAAFQGQPMFCGIIRAMFPETAHLSETVPHVDCLPRSVAELEQQLSANIYLQTPPSGGELIIWDTPAFAYDEVKRFEGAQLPEQRLQTPLRIRPRKNELVIINTRRPHAICGFDSGTRISMQSFIGYIPGEPFYFWC